MLDKPRFAEDNGQVKMFDVLVQETLNKRVCKMKTFSCQSMREIKTCDKQERLIYRYYQC